MSEHKQSNKIIPFKLFYSEPDISKKMIGWPLIKTVLEILPFEIPRGTTNKFPLEKVKFLSTARNHSETNLKV